MVNSEEEMVNDNIWRGIGYISLGLIGNIGVGLYAWFTTPEIFVTLLSTTLRHTVLGVMTYGEIANCVYMVCGLGVLFIAIGLTFILGRKHFA